jgi:type I restriction enzyme S subunit
VLFTVTGSYGVPIYVETHEPFCFQRHIGLIKPYIVDGRFLKVFLSSAFVKHQCDEKATGIAQKTVGLETLRKIVLPLPPLAEQHRIVAAIESAFAVIDEIEAAKGDLKTAVERSKQKILSLAITGKLVPQDPADEPASVLLQRIRAEREQLVKADKTKASKRKSSAPNRHCGLDPQSQSSVDNSYYAGLPKSWAWARVIDICEPQESKLPTGETFRYIDIDAIDNKRHRVAEPKTMPTSQAPSRAAKGVKAGDTLFSMVRPYLQNIALVTDELSDCIASTGFYVCRPVQEIICPEYLYRFFVSDYAINGINAYMRGDNSPSIRKDEMDNFGVPIPPLAEQRRIVAAIEAAFEQLDNIAATLE